MGNIQKTLDSLKPYIIGIRYVDGVPVVDVLFKNEWVVPEDKGIKRIKGNEELNYYMLYSELEGYDVDDLLKYVDRTIKLNQEREKKHELLILKINELKDLFKRNGLEKLTQLKFSFNEVDSFTPTISELDIKESTSQTQVNLEGTIEDSDISNTNYNATQIGQNLSEEDLEILEEERRAEVNRKIISEKKKGAKLTPKIELPPKKLVDQSANYDAYSDTCDCADNEACDKCIDSK